MVWRSRSPRNHSERTTTSPFGPIKLAAPRLQLPLIVITLLLLALLLGRCTAPEREADAGNSVAVPRLVASVEHLESTINAGEVKVSFDLVVTPAATQAVSVEYRIGAGRSGTAFDDVPAITDSVRFAAGESRRRVERTFTAQAPVDAALRLIASDTLAVVGAGTYPLKPVEITPVPLRPAKPTVAVDYTVTLSVSPAELGTVSGGGTYAKGRMITVQATPLAGSEFVKWSEGDVPVSSQARLSIRVDRNRTLAAHFQPASPVAAAETAGAQGKGMTVLPADDFVDATDAENDIVAVPASAAGALPDAAAENHEQATPVLTPDRGVEGRHDGHVYLKLNGKGEPLADQSLDYGTAPWSCLLDRTTGLVWESKSDDEGLHDKDWTYSWYDSNPYTHGGHGGAAAKGFCGGSIATGCDTEKFVAAVNAAGLCGASDWRLPTLEELRSIVALQRSNPAADDALFPHMRPAWYWSSSTASADISHAWIIGFHYGYDVWGRKSSDFHVRLVRRAQ